MTTPIASTFTFTDRDGFEIFVRKWAPPAGTGLKAAVQVADGASEHSLRYERFAKCLAEAGYVVYADDHRGHGMTAGTLEKAGDAGSDGWNGMVAGLHQLTGIIKEQNPGLPVFFFGHSMGSMLGQTYAEHWGDELKGLVLSGTSGFFPNHDAIIAAVEAEPQDQPSALFIGMFAGFAQPFAPIKTGFEWLSRDEAEVQKYVDDPWCGFPFKSSLVVDFMRGLRDTWRPENEARIPVTLPIYVVSGEEDPVGGNTQAVSVLLERYGKLGIQDLTHKFYECARHEILNETCRDEVQQDLLDWFDAHLK